MIKTDVRLFSDQTLNNILADMLVHYLDDEYLEHQKAYIFTNLRSFSFAILKENNFKSKIKPELLPYLEAVSNHQPMPKDHPFCLTNRF